MRNLTAETTEAPDDGRDVGPPERSSRLADEAREAVGRARRDGGTPAPRRRTTLPRVPVSLEGPEVALARVVEGSRLQRALRDLDEAAQSYAAERFEDARRLLRPLARQAPKVAEVRELYGLTLYRLRRWEEAIEELEAFRDLAGTTEAHPVLADCHRALGHWSDVDALWEELKEASPSAELVTEGRIVAAGALADRGELKAAVRELEKGWKAPSRAREHHLRRAYALADLYERAGATAKARDLFGWVAGLDRDFADVGDRVRALR